MRVVMTAAHGGYDSDRVPLGGGAAVCERLRTTWPVTLIGSGPLSDHRLGGLGDRVPSQLSEFEYARFCRRFEREATELILGMSPRPVVLSHDISEGPSFTRLARAGVDCLAILHVDVVDYFQRFYLGDVLPARSWTWLHRSTREWLKWPDLLQLVFEKQLQAAQSCRYLVVPSLAMKRVLLECYPQMPPGRVQVVPWGAPLVQPSAEEVEAAKVRLRAEWGEGPFVMTLSRISPEKSQDVLLREVRGGTVVIVGAPSYMRGQRFYEKLKRTACARPVIFAGHLGGAEKRAALELASVFVVCSRHESYGLTILEAMAAGCPIVGVRSYGVDATVEPAWGRVVETGAQLGGAIQELLDDPALAARLGAAARERALQCSFQAAADELWRLCEGAGSRGDRALASQLGQLS